MNEYSSPPSGAARADLIGRVLTRRYRLTRLVATGGMAQVWEAEDQVLARPVAVKLLHPHLAADQSFVNRFRHEAIAAARLSHPSIVSIYDTVSDDGHEAIVMELVRGITLRARLDAVHQLEIPDAVSAGAQVADALEVAHRAHVVHRDIKPANILLNADGRVMVADFGIAKALQAGDLTAEGTMLGTAKYLAPEQVEGASVDARTDLYSLAVVLYESICGRPPFHEETDAATALARLHQTPLRPRQIRASVPKPVEEVVMRAMARQPADRFGSAAEFRAALLASLHGRVPDTLPPPAPPIATSPPPGATEANRAAARSEPEPEWQSGPYRPTVANIPAPLVVPTRPRSDPPTPPRLPVLPMGTEPRPDRPSRRSRQRRRWVLPLLLLGLVAVALGIAGVLISRTGSTKSVLGPSGTPAPIAAVSATPYDPQDQDGFGTENNDLAPRVLDGDPATMWSTAQYQDPKPLFGNLKQGVGIYLKIARPQSLRQLIVQSPDIGWSAQVYVAAAPPPQLLTPLAYWGKARATKTNIVTPTTTFDVGGARGTVILLWITRLPTTGYLRVSEMKVTG